MSIKNNCLFPTFVVLRLSLIMFLLCGAHNLSLGQGLSVHTDRTIYFPGDTVWFKAYFKHGNTFDEEVKNLYFSPFSNADGVSTPLQESVLFIDRGVSAGQYIIPRDFTKDELYLSFFTKRSLDTSHDRLIKKLAVIQEGVTEIISNESNSSVDSLNKSIVKGELIMPSVILDQFSAQPLGANRITLNLSDSEAANLSISITDISIPTASTQNIGADFQATSSLDTMPVIADSVLYLRGKLGVKKDWTKYYERYQKIQQKDVKAGKPRRGLSLSLRMLNDSLVRYREVIFDKDGYFGSKEIVFSDTIEVRAVQVYEKMKFYDFTTEYFFNDLVGQHDYKLNKSTIPNLQDSSKRIKLSTFYHPDYTIDASGRRVLKTVNINRKVDLKLQQMANKLSRGWFAQHPSYLDIDVQNDLTIPAYIDTLESLIDYLKLKYPKLNASKPVILVNNSEYKPNDSSGYVPSTIQEIKLIRLYDNYPRNPVGRGAIMIYADIDGRNRYSGQGVTLHQVAGYMSTLPFYSPQYNTAEKQVKTPYDDRLTLYWNPYIHLDTTNSSMEILFHNNSNAKGFHVVINGMTDSGKRIYYSNSFIK
ncbi:hypothetical protein ACFX5U_12815 [Sphingobacterium sp. SG20118]|uniref:hypothetical protein n=1 Tax=Sphingobacterium sp. SG20118 TaxID=3367156 RepID=UPI0037DFC903